MGIRNVIKVGEMAKAGNLTYVDMKIEDNSRKLQTPYISNQLNIFLCTEKDTAYPVADQLLKFFECCALSSKGQSALTAAERLLDAIEDSIKPATPLYLVALTDYDPRGVSIQNTFRGHMFD